MITKIVFGLAAIYVLICLGMFLAQKSFLFHPRGERGSPTDHGVPDFARVSFETEDGVSLVGWFRGDPGYDKAMVFFYGNADALGGYGAFFRDFAAAGYAVLGVNYRGYGGSGGEPSEEGFYKDADAALEFIGRHVPSDKVVVIGRSIGSGVAVDLAARNRLKAVALISPFTSMTDIASEVFWYLPVRTLLRYRFASVDKIKQVSAPVLILHGDADTLIPARHGRTLYAAANEPKRLEIFEGADHNHMDLAKASSAVIDFVREHEKDGSLRRATEK